MASPATSTATEDSKNPDKAPDNQSFKNNKARPNGVLFLHIKSSGFLGSSALLAVASDVPARHDIRARPIGKIQDEL